MLNMKALIGAAIIALAAIPAMGADNCVFKMINREGQTVGTVELKETPHGVLIQAKAEGIPEGPHAFHLHQTGRCDAPAFKTAGGHLNPAGKTHGFLSPEGHHLGDLPNVKVGKDGVLRVDAFVPGVTLKAGPNSLADEDGTALVIHQGADDYATDPAGAAGDRIACAVLR